MKIGRAVEDLLRVPAYFAPRLFLIFKWIALMCAFRVLAVPNATPLPLPQKWSLWRTQWLVFKPYSLLWGVQDSERVGLRNTYF